MLADCVVCVCSECASSLAGGNLYVYSIKCLVRVPAGVKGLVERLLIQLRIQTVGDFPSPHFHWNADLESNSQRKPGLSIICKLASQCTPTGTFQHSEGDTCGQV